jgi:hypothetical protein
MLQLWFCVSVAILVLCQCCNFGLVSVLQSWLYANVAIMVLSQCFNHDIVPAATASIVVLFFCCIYGIVPNLAIMVLGQCRSLKKIRDNEKILQV